MPRGAKLGSRLALLRAFTGAARMRQRCCYSPSRWRPPFYEGEHLPEWRAFLKASPYFSPRKMPLIVVIIAAAVVTALLRMAGIN